MDTIRFAFPMTEIEVVRFQDEFVPFAVVQLKSGQLVVELYGTKAPLYEAIQFGYDAIVIRLKAAPSSDRSVGVCTTCGAPAFKK